jgi:hypothetical protein
MEPGILAIRSAAWRNAFAGACLVLLAGCTLLDSTGGPEDHIMYGGWMTDPKSAGNGGRDVSLSLDANRTATISSAFPGKPSRFLVRGTWTREGTRVQIDLVGQHTERMIFELRGDYLIPKEWDKKTWGDAGPGTLIRRP